MIQANVTKFGQNFIVLKIFLTVRVCQSLLTNKFLRTYAALKIRENNVWLSRKYILKYVAFMAFIPKKIPDPWSGPAQRCLKCKVPIYVKCFVRYHTAH